ncbi:MAG: hypothetical protein ACYS7Y_20270 [Planctomycetota bacterium]|jgi:hypothetical protein
MRQPIEQCDALLTHDLGPVTEDGERYLVTCWDIVAQAADGRQWLFPQAFPSEEAGQALAERVEEYGSIDPEKWREITPAGLPDYVTDWHRPEFN